MNAGIARAGLAALVFLAACGEADSSVPFATAVPKTPTPRVAEASQAARTELLNSVTKTEADSVHMNATVQESLSGTGEFAAMTAQSVKITLQADVASSTSMSGTVAVSYLGRDKNIPVVVSGGTAYISLDGGATWETETTSASMTSNLNAPLEYLQDVGDVADVGPATVDGIAVEEYRATIDAAKATGYMRNALSAASSSSSKLAKALAALTVTGGTLIVDLDADGHIVKESGDITASAEASAIDPTETGTLTVDARIEAGYGDYGAKISVTPPPA